MRCALFAISFAVCVQACFHGSCVADGGTLLVDVITLRLVLLQCERCRYFCLLHYVSQTILWKFVKLSVFHIIDHEPLQMNIHILQFFIVSSPDANFQWWVGITCRTRRDSHWSFIQSSIHWTIACNYEIRSVGSVILGSRIDECCETRFSAFDNRTM